MCQGNKLEAGPRRLSRSLLRHRHLRIARGRLRRRAGQGRPAADRRYLQHLPAAHLRSDFPGSRAAESAGHVHARPRRTRPDPMARRITACSISATCGCSRTWSSWRPATKTICGKMLEFALATMRRCRFAIRRPTAENVTDRRAPVEFGRAEVLHWGSDGMLIACGTLLGNCLKAAAALRAEGLDVGVINARFIKPLDTETILQAIETVPVVVTVEEVRWPAASAARCSKRRPTPGSRSQPRSPARHSRSLHRARRPRRIARRPRSRPGRHRRRPAAPQPTKWAFYKTAVHRRVS